jgi:flagellar biosynthesis/type III secretory pathway protein FliH
MNMTLEERERQAYITGDTHASALLAEALNRIEEAADDLADQVDDAYRNGYDTGYSDGQEDAYE